MMFAERIVDRVYRWALRLLPRPFRETFGDDMAKTFADRILQARARRGPVAVIIVATREVIGVIITAWQEQRRGSGRGSIKAGRHTKRFAERLAIVLTEVRHSARALISTPGFTLPVVLTLTLGVGAITAIFGVIRGVVIKPLPYPNPSAIVWLDHSAPGIDLERGLGLTAGLYTYYGEQSVFSSVAVYEELALTINDANGPEQIEAARVTPSTLTVLQIQPLLGSWFWLEDESTGVPQVVLSHELWLRRYGGNADIVGNTVRVQGVTSEIIGIMPPGYGFPTNATEAWIPLRIVPDGRLGGFNFRGIARLSAGISTEDAATRLNDALTRLPQRFSDPFATSVVTNAKIGTLVTTLQNELVGGVRVTLWILMGSVGMVLILACLNVTNLVMVRAEAKSHDTSIRTALGASRGHLLGHFLSETMLLVGISAGLGLIVGGLSLNALVTLDPADIPRLHEVRLDRYVVTFAATIALIVGVWLTGIRFVRSIEPRQFVGRGAASGHTLGADRMRQVIGVAQITIALILLVGSGLMIKTFRNIRGVDLGFSSDNVLTFELGLPQSDYPTPQHASSFQRELVTQLQSLPGAAAVGAVSRCLPLGGWCGGDPLAVQGRAVPVGEIPPIVALRTATGGYLDAMGIQLLSGRWFREDNGDENVAVVSKALADRYWPNEDPIGQRVSDRGADTPDTGWYTVVGVVGNTPARSVTDVNTPMIYFPPTSVGNRGPSSHTMRVVVRTSVPPLSLASSVRSVVNTLDPNVPLASVETLERVVNNATAHTSFVTVLLGIASGMALILGIIGVYSIVSYTVSRRQAEIGIRLALGANRTDVNRLIMRYAGQVAVVGCLAGLLVTVAMSRFVESLLFGVSPIDPGTYVGVTGTILVTTLAAAYVPARRASHADPTTTLRQ